MKKVIFVAVFTNINYVYMLSLLAKSIFLYGNIDDDTDILIYTSSKFKRIIENSSYYSPRRIRFFINNSIDTIDKACKSRLDLFDYKYIDKYDKILYLDTDILVQKNINFIFDDSLFSINSPKVFNNVDVSKSLKSGFNTEKS